MTKGRSRACLTPSLGLFLVSLAAQPLLWLQFLDHPAAITEAPALAHPPLASAGFLLTLVSLLLIRPLVVDSARVSLLPTSDRIAAP